MRHRITRLFKPLSRLLWPGSGHRPRTVAVQEEQVPVTFRSEGATVRSEWPTVRSEWPTVRRVDSNPPRGEEHALLCPCRAVDERRREAQRQWARRRALLLAVHGIDVGPYGIDIRPRELDLKPYGIDPGPRVTDVWPRLIHGAEATA